jgi:hypothetical protein
VPKRESNYYLEDNADEQVRMEKNRLCGGDFVTFAVPKSEIYLSLR